MDKIVFQKMLEGRNVPAEKIPAAIALAERFEDYILSNGESFTPQVAWDFSKILIAEGLNNEENFITLARYRLFIKSNPIYVAFLDSLDGGEAQENLYTRVNEQYGEALRDEVFADSMWGNGNRLRKGYDVHFSPMFAAERTSLGCKLHPGGSATCRRPSGWMWANSRPRAITSG